MSWAWWDWPLTWLTNHCLSVLWHCWLGHMTRKIVSEMTYNVSSGTLNPTILCGWDGNHTGLTASNGSVLPDTWVTSFAVWLPGAWIRSQRSCAVWLPLPLPGWVLERAAGLWKSHFSTLRDVFLQTPCSTWRPLRCDVGLKKGAPILRKLSLCYSIVYYYNGTQRYEQFLQVGRLDCIGLWTSLV